MHLDEHIRCRVRLALARPEASSQARSSTGYNVLIAFMLQRLQRSVTKTDAITRLTL